MTSVHETAYPRFKPELTIRELSRVYELNNEELQFIRKLSRKASGKLYLAILLKSVQRLGYFPLLADIPSSIIVFLNKRLEIRTIPMRDLIAEEKSYSRQKFKDAIRNHVNINPITPNTYHVIEQAATSAAQTKQELADIINVVIEELIRQRFELPAFGTLSRLAQHVRSEVNDKYFHSITQQLTPEVIEQLNTMLKVADGQTFSGWQKLKQEPRKPTNAEIRQYLDHHAWLKNHLDSLPSVAHIPAVIPNAHVVIDGEPV